MKRTGHHASNFAWRLQLGSFYVLATLSCALATASTVTSRPAQAFDEDEHSKYCCCGPACRKESCCCGPRETSSSTPKPLEASTQSRVDFDGNLCLHRAPCHDSGLPTGPSVTSTAKAAALDVPAFLAHPDSWEAKSETNRNREGWPFALVPVRLPRDGLHVRRHDRVESCHDRARVARYASRLRGVTSIA